MIPGQSAEGMLVHTDTVRSSEAPPTVPPDIAADTHEQAQALLDMPEYCTGLDITERDGVCVASFSGRMIVNEDGVERTQQALLALQEKGIHIVLDFTGVTLISSAVLNALLTLRMKLQTAGLQLRLCGMGPEAIETFTESGLHRDFDIDAMLAEALAQIQRSSPAGA